MVSSTTSVTPRLKTVKVGFRCSIMTRENIKVSNFSEDFIRKRQIPLQKAGNSLALPGDVIGGARTTRVGFDVGCAPVL